MIILGIVYEKLEILKQNKKYDYILGLIDEMNQLINNMEIKDQLKNIPCNYNIQMMIANKLSQVRMNQGIPFKSYIKCIDGVLQGIKFIEENNLDKIVEEYIKGYKNYFNPYFCKKPYVLENFLVNEIFKELIPFGRFDSIWDSYVYMSTIYSIVKFHLIGISTFNKKLSDKLVVETIYPIARVMLHNPVYIQTIVKLLKDSELNTLAHMCILIKRDRKSVV